MFKIEIIDEWHEVTDGYDADTIEQAVNIVKEQISTYGVSPNKVKLYKEVPIKVDIDITLNASE